MWLLADNISQQQHYVLMKKITSSPSPPSFLMFDFFKNLFPNWRNRGLCECRTQMLQPKLRDLENRGFFRLDFPDLKFASCPSSEYLLG